MARPKLSDGDTQRLQLKIGDDELREIEDWRFANRIQSRSEAVRRLCKIGLLVDEVIDVAVDASEKLTDATYDNYRYAADWEEWLQDNGDDDGAIDASVTNLASYAETISDLSKIVRNMIVGIHNGIAPLADAKDLNEATARSKKNLEDVAATLENIYKRMDEREDNYLFSLVFQRMSVGQRAAYQKLSEPEQDAFWATEKQKLRDEMGGENQK
ncbi:hypothetical protein [Aureimonas frigidaquae]|uniref:Uncharacterized protein n=1 Tax=Aureimonas frigidaquae TaxID=424757 RepID=A0A0P0Z3P8_9HYPH|nr:hypothetical protein [Aureimonas frigidaquae]BAT28718.1 hypothetical protein [Aureimonas frigidaquae]